MKVLPLDRIVGTTPYRYFPVQMNHLPLTGVGTDFVQVKKTRPYWQLNGHCPENGTEMLVGQDIATTTRIKPGDSVSLAGTRSPGEKFRLPLTVAGILKTGGKEDRFVFLELSLLNRLVGSPGAMEIAELSIAAPGDELEMYRQQIEQNVSNVIPRLVKRITRSETTVLAKLQALVYLVRAVILVLTMMAVVMERRKEIGLKKAIGADNAGLVREFMGMGIVLGTVGGILGCVTGYFFAVTISLSVFGRSVSVLPSTVLMTLVFSIVVTAMACLLPVKKAVDIEPAHVLRGE